MNWTNSHYEWFTDGKSRPARLPSEDPLEVIDMPGTKSCLAKMPANMPETGRVLISISGAMNGFFIGNRMK